MEKPTNMEQSSSNSDEQILLDRQSKQKEDETKKKPLFTVMKFFMVFAILGFLAITVFVIYQLGRCDITGEGARRSATSAQLANINSIIGQYLVDMRYYPKMLEELFENKNNDPRWNGPYLKKSQLKDPWGNPYQYRYPGNHQDYELYSYGADGQSGGEGDNADIRFK